MATRSIWQRPPEPLRYDVAIVGGGIVGTATAYALARRAPTTRVAILDADALAAGASGRNAGFLLLGTHADYASAVDAYGRDAARRIWRFTHENVEAVRALAATVDVGFEATGSVLAAGSTAEAARLQRSCALLADDGVASTWHGVEGIGALGLSGFHGALTVPQGGAVDPARLVQALAEASGAEVQTGWRVDRLVSASDGVQIGVATGDVILAGRAVIATNAYAPRLVPALADAVRPVRAQMLATAPAPPCVPTPVYSHDGYFYVRQRADGRVLVGGARHLHEADEVGYADATTPALQADLEGYLRTHVPALGPVAVERRWSGTMGFSPDGLPALGAVPGVPEALFAVGFTGHGMGYGLRFGDLIARTLLGQVDPAADLFRTPR